MRKRSEIACTIGILLAACFLFWNAPTLIRAQAPASATEEFVEVNASAPAHPFPHFWERMFGSGRATLSLRASYRRDLAELKQATGVEYIRFHGIFDDDVGIYQETPAGEPIYNFSYVDQIYDGLLDMGVRPFVELSFMPRKLAARQVLHPFWYSPVVSPPRDWNKWSELISHFAQHLVDRYGIDEVAQWYFEVWNEPNLDFWAGEPKQATYDKLYDVTARALKSVSPRLRVGGPATAQAAWVDQFIPYTVEHGIPVDFISTHVYGNDSPENVLGTKEEIPISRLVCRAVKKVHDQIRDLSLPNLPLIFSEYNASFENEPAITDSVFMGPWLADTVRQCTGLAYMMSFWTFSDVFEEQGVVKKPLYGGFGLIAEDGIKKPSYNAFALLHRLGDRQIDVSSDSVLATLRSDGVLELAAWNLCLPGQPGNPVELTIKLDGLPPGVHQAVISRLDEDHGSVSKAYDAMGQPAYPTRRQIQELRAAAELPPPQTESLAAPELKIRLPRNGLALIEIR